jgi:hypothetical protein
MPAELAGISVQLADNTVSAATGQGSNRLI